MFAQIKWSRYYDKHPFIQFYDNIAQASYLSIPSSNWSIFSWYVSVSYFAPEAATEGVL